MAALPQLTREKLKLFLPTPELIRAYEALQQGLQFAPEQLEAAQATADAAQVAADAAQASANTAQTTANGAVVAAATAQTSANTAQAQVTSLNAVPFVTIGTSAVTPNERALAVSADLTLTDGGAGGSATLGLNQGKVVLPADVSDSTAVFVDATGFLLALAANATYLIDGVITFQSAAVTTGIGLCFTLPAGAAISGGYNHNTTATAIEGSYNNASGAVKGNTSGVLAALDNVPISGRWVITTSATAGNAQMQFRSEVAASAVTLKANLSVLLARRIA